MSEDLNYFLSQDCAENGNLPKGKGAQNIKERINGQLVKNHYAFTGFYVALSVAGYLFSLLFCAQNANGFSMFSQHVAHNLHSLPDVICAPLCGAAFSIIPVFSTLFIFNRFQKRYLFSKFWWYMILFPPLFASLFLLIPSNILGFEVHEHVLEHYSDTTWLGMWTLSAILTPYISFLLIYLNVFKKRKVS